MAEPVALAFGSHVGPYLIEARLGQGGMATVYSAMDIKLQRRVALKVLHEDLAVTPQVRARFLREAQAAARLKHPNLVEVHDAAEIDGRLILVMEYIEGQPLDRCRFDRRASVEIVRKVAEAIENAHRHSVIHRDLKPGNVIVDATGEPHIVDFGLALLSDSAARLTRTGSQIGTPMYMAPEQVAAQPDQISERTDVYALGGILYELLTGRPPHTASSLAEIYAKILNEDPLQPSKVRAGLPADLETICLKALSKEPERRYAHAADFAEDLRRWLDGEPIQARRSSVFYRIRRQIRRRRIAFATLGASLLAGAIIAAVMIPKIQKEREAKDQARIAQEEAERALDAQREKARREKEDADRALEAQKKKDESLRVLGQLWNKIVFAKNNLYRGQIDPARGRAELRGAVDNVNTDSPQAFYVRARGRLYLQDRDGAENDLLEALKLRRDFDPAWALLGLVRLERYRRSQYGTDLDKPGSEMNAILDSAKDALGHVSSSADWDKKWGLIRTHEDDVTETITRVLIADRLHGDKDSALRILKEAMKDYQSDEYYILMGSFAADLNERLEWLGKAIDLMPGNARAWLNRGMARNELQDDKGALADYNRAIELDPDDSIACAARGAVRANLGDGKGALDDINRALELEPTLKWVHYNRGLAHSLCHEFREAIADYDRALDRNPRQLPAWYQKALAESELGEHEAAIVSFTRCIEINPKETRAWYGRGVEKSRCRRYKEAIKE